MGTRVGAYCIRPYRFNVYPFAPCRAFGRAYAIRPYPAGKKSDLMGWWEVTFGTRGDEYVFLFSTSNRLSDRHPCRGVLHTSHIDSTSILSPLAGRIWGRMLLRPTLPAEKLDLKGWWEVMFGTREDEYVFHSIMSNRLLDRHPGRGVLHTPSARLSSTPTPFAGRLVGRKQYAPTFPEKDKVSLGRCYLLSWTMGDKSVFHFFMSNRLSDRYPCGGVLHTPLARLSSTLSPFAGRLVGCMQYAPTLSKKDEGSSGRYFLLSGTRRDSSTRRTKKGRIFWREDRRRKV